MYAARLGNGKNYVGNTKRKMHTRSYKISDGQKFRENVTHCGHEQKFNSIYNISDIKAEFPSL